MPNPTAEEAEAEDLLSRLLNLAEEIDALSTRPSARIAGTPAFSNEMQRIKNSTGETCASLALCFARLRGERDRYKAAADYLSRKYAGQDSI